MLQAKLFNCHNGPRLIVEGETKAEILTKYNAMKNSEPLKRMPETCVYRTLRKYYINFIYNGERETVDEFIGIQETRRMLREYQLVDSGYYMSARACKNWKG
jgi:type III secretory pathway component EscV